MTRWTGVLIACLAAANGFARAQEPGPPPESSPPDSRFDAHFQLTTVTQTHPRFDAPYSGKNSLSPDPEHETTITSTVFLGARLWKGAELYVNPELSGGSGLSHAFGVAGFPNGESFRVGDPQPHVYLGRLMLRQSIAAGTEMEAVEDKANQLGGSRAVRRWTITLGKFGVTDIFDDNDYSHDPRTQFLNWADWTPGAWDYPADTRGYTWGLAVEYDAEAWAVRLAAAAEPKEANGLEIDKDLGQAHSLIAEVDRKYALIGQKGEAKLIVFLNRARMGNYRDALAEDEGAPPDIVATRRPGRTKWGLAMTFQQALGKSLGLFLRGSWNDGRNEAWAYAEIERSVTAGALWKAPWKARPDDEAGLAVIANGLSKDHRDYLAAGGYGFMIGDGRLRYGPEEIAELYYAALVYAHLWLTADYQFVQNPAYNRDRGPAHIFGLRFHAEI